MFNSIDDNVWNTLIWGTDNWGLDLRVDNFAKVSDGTDSFSTFTATSTSWTTA